jgi:hypothetical protein
MLTTASQVFDRGYLALVRHLALQLEVEYGSRMKESDLGHNGSRRLLRTKS